MSNDSEVLAVPSHDTRYETLIRVSNVIGTYRDQHELFRMLVRELHQVVRFDYVGVSFMTRGRTRFSSIASMRKQRQLSLRTPNWRCRNPMPGGCTKTKSRW